MAVVVKLTYFLLLFSFLEAASVQGPASLLVDLDAEDSNTLVNEVAAIGQQVKFIYTVEQHDEWPDWILTKDGKTNPQLIASKCEVELNFRNQYRIEDQGRSCDLIILNATFDEAGVYTCRPIDKANVSALLTIIDPSVIVVVHNETEELVENDLLSISCSLTYCGATESNLTIRVSLNWTTSADDPNQNFTFSETNSSTTPTIITKTSIAKLIVKRPIVPIFTCEAKFNLSDKHPSSSFSNELISNTYSWKTENTYLVSYPPSSASITSGKCHKGLSKLKCYADSHPSSNYHWMDHCTTPISINSTIEMQYPGTYNCTAYNTIRGKNYTVSNSFEFLGCPLQMNNCESLVCEIGFAVLGFTCIVLLLLLVIPRCRRKLGKRSDYGPIQPTANNGESSSSNVDPSTNNSDTSGTISRSVSQQNN